MLADPREQLVGPPPAAGREGVLRRLDGAQEPAEVADLLTDLALDGAPAGLEDACAGSAAEQLGSDMPKVQRAACLALQSLGADSAGGHASKLAPLLASEEASVRRAACEALSAIGPRGHGAAADLGLAPLLADSDASVRCAALRATGALQDASLLDDVAARLSDGRPEVAAAACCALAALAPLPGSVAGGLGARLEEGRTRAAALEALAGLEEGADFQHGGSLVSKCLGDKDLLTRERAILALGHLAAPVSQQKGLVEKVVEQLKSDEPYQRCTAALALGQMGERAMGHAQAIADLLSDEAEDKSGKALQVSGAFVRQPPYMKKPKCAAIAALGMLGKAWAEEAQDSDEWEFEGKIEGMLKEEDWEVRACALAALLQLGEKSKADVDAVAELLEDDTYRVRAGACALLGSLKAADKTDQLADVLADTAPSVRAAALQALALIGEDAADCAPKVLARLDDHVDAVRAAAMRAIGGLGEYGRCFAGVLVNALQEEHSPEVRCAGLAALGQMEAYGAAFADEVAEFLGDEAAPVQMAAQEALVAMGAY